MLPMLLRIFGCQEPVLRGHRRARLIRSGINLIRGTQIPDMQVARFRACRAVQQRERLVQLVRTKGALKL